MLADDYESAYARRLRGFESPTYKMPSSYINARYGSAFNYVSAYDPAFYNIVVMGDQVWVEPKYITSMFGSWGTVIYADPWYYGLEQALGPELLVRQLGLELRVELVVQSLVRTRLGTVVQLVVRPLVRIRAGAGGPDGTADIIYGPGSGAGLDTDGLISQTSCAGPIPTRRLREPATAWDRIPEVRNRPGRCAAAAAAAGTPSACATTAAGGTRPEEPL